MPYFSTNEQSDNSHCHPEPHLQSPKHDKRSQTTDVDLTFQSFVCTGGEVEIADTLHYTEQSIILPQDQATPNPCEAEDLEISNSNIIQSCRDHIEHPYHNPENRDAFQNEQNVGEENNITWRSFACDGGEVEIFNATTTAEETIYLPVEQLEEHLQEQSVNATHLSDVELQHVEHKDHPYCHDVGVKPSETTLGLDLSESGPDLTLKSFHCTGGEVLVCDGTILRDETIPLPALQSGIFSESCSYSASILVSHQDVQNTDHADHPYCTVQSSLSTPDGNVLVDDEPSPVEDSKQVSLTNTQDCATSAPFRNSGSEDSLGSYSSPVVLPDDQAVICESSAPIDAPDASFQETPEATQPLNSHLQNIHVPADVNSPGLRLYQTLPTYSESVNLNNKSSDSPIQETLKEEKPESHPNISAETCTPVQVHLSSVHEQSSEDKDSALGSSGNVPVACNSAEHPAENLSEVLKVLSECPSVASALQFGLLSPVVRRASLFLSGAIRAPAADGILMDDSALEVEKSLLAPVDVNDIGLWAENIDLTMPQPLLNSTALGCKPQPSAFPELTEDGEAMPPKEKPALDAPLIQEGPLQQQLRQMAEFLLLASGKIGPAGVSVPLQPPAVTPVPSARAPPAESCSVAIGTSPVRWANHSVNTSGQFERRREFSVADSCTLTDPLLWK